MTIQEEFSTQPPVQSEIKRVSGPPEGELAAPRGTIVLDANGRAYIKMSEPQESGGWNLLLPTLVFATLADFLAHEYHEDNWVAICLGATVKGDHGNGSGIYYFDSADLTANDSGTNCRTMRPTDIATDLLPGRWMLFDKSGLT
jgi:hypothetical protein